MFRRKIAAVEAARAAVDFSLGAWRRLWAIQAVGAVGLALLFIAVRGQTEPELTGEVTALGWLMALLAWAPLWTGLHRLAIGGSAALRINQFGLQFGLPELRMLGLGLGLTGAVILALLPMIAISAVMFIVFRPLGIAHMGPLGDLSLSFVLVAMAWLAAMAGLAYGALRFALAPSATVGKRRLVLLDAWPLTEGRVAPLAGAWVLAQIPTVLMLGLIAVVDWVEFQQQAVGARGHWPLLDAAAGGLLFGFALTFVQAPMTAGVLGLFYRAQRADRNVPTTRKSTVDRILGERSLSSARALVH